jgi:hypothetical protein
MESILTLLIRFRRLLRYFLLDRREAMFIQHNRRVWSGVIPADTQGEILLELDEVASSIISYSYLATVLASKHKARIVPYVIRPRQLRSIMSTYKTQRIYRSFNAQAKIYITLSHRQWAEVRRLAPVVYSSLRTKRDVEGLTIDGIWIGDLLYDSYTMKYRVPTVEVCDTRFRETLEDAISFYIFWRDYLDSHDVKAIILTHCVYYQNATILRLAARRGIPTYQSNATHVYYLSQDNLRAYAEFFYHPEYFAELDDLQQETARQLAKAQLDRRFSGEVGVDMHYSTKSAYAKRNANRVLSESAQVKILIAPHCFFDSPHPYGVNLFPDFYEWLTFLGEVSMNTDYEWYIKIHPDFIPENLKIIQSFIDSYPQFRIIPAETSHRQLINEGIKFALTVYGTIGYEYAALGVPVINCSLCNPRIRYNINFHPRTVDEYKELLLTLSKRTLRIDVDDVYESYYMAYLHNPKNWLFNDYDAFLKRIGGYHKQLGSVSYEEFIREFNSEKHERIIASLERFIDSKDYWYQRKHMVKCASSS